MKLRLSSDAVERVLRAAGVNIDDGGGPPVPPEQEGSQAAPVGYEAPLLVANQDSPLLVDEDDWVSDPNSDLDDRFHETGVVR